MKRPIALVLGLVVSVGVVARGEEVVWRAAKPDTVVTPISGKEESRAPEPTNDPPLLLAPQLTTTSEPPASPPKPVGEPLGTPRTLPAEIKPAKPPLSFLPPYDNSAMRTLTLVSEGECPPEAAMADPGRRFYFKAEYLLWFMKRMIAPPLVTTAPVPAGGVLPPNFGQIGAPGTVVLFGDGPIGNAFHMGGRFTAGAWLDCEQTCGVDASYFFLGRNAQDVVFSSPAFPVILRPFIQVNPPPQPNFQIVAFPPGSTQNGAPFPAQTGSVTIDTSSGLQGAEFNVKECLCRHCCVTTAMRVDLFAGFRNLDLDDRVSITENIVIGANNVAGFPPGSIALVNDTFATHDQFYGGQVGASFEYRQDRFVVDGRASVALGGTHEVILINGSQRVTPPGAPTQFFNGGLLALPSNIGRWTTGRFSVVPEVTLNAGYMIGPRLKAFVGYNVLLWSPLARAAEQIDPVLDISQIPNFSNPPPPPVVPTRPIVPFRQNTLWAQGVQLGVELRW